MDVDINFVMASLDLNENKKRRLSGNDDEQNVQFVEEGVPGTSTGLENGLRRSGRKKIKPMDNEKRRVLTKPKRLSSFNGTNLNEIHNYYLDKRVKKMNSSLETIFEEPQKVGGQLMMIGSRKLRRALSFNNSANPNKQKVKKRQMKAKKNCIKKKFRKISKEMLLKKLSIIDDENSDSE